MTSYEFRTNPLFLRNQFATDGLYDMPYIYDSGIFLDDAHLIGYDKVSTGEYEKIVHFFLDDYKFTALWNRPDECWAKLKPFAAVLSPQFSLFTEMPRAVQLHQIFKSRWCGAYLQSKGLSVIPSLVWGGTSTFEFCFDGIEHGSIVAVSTLGWRTEKDLFLAGYNQMLVKIQPRSIICYGSLFGEMTGPIISVDYAETNHLGTKSVSNFCEISKVISGYILHEKGGGSAGSSGRSLPPVPKFPGWDKTVSPGEGFSWRGSGTSADGRGNWYNPRTKEWLHADLEHPAPYGPHWDYGIKGSKDSYRIYPDSHFEKKEFILEGCVL